MAPAPFLHTCSGLARGQRSMPAWGVGVCAWQLVFVLGGTVADAGPGPRANSGIPRAVTNYPVVSRRPETAASGNLSHTLTRILFFPHPCISFLCVTDNIAVLAHSSIPLCRVGGVVLRRQGWPPIEPTGFQPCERPCETMNKCRVATGLFLWTMFAATGAGQTLVDLRTQSKSVDFSAAASTKPMQTGSGLPGTCAIGQFFFLTTAPAGSAVYACNPANAWTVEGNSLSVTGSTANEVLSSNGSAIQWLALGGDISGAPEGLTVTRLQGRNVSGATPSSAQVLQWNATANQWQPAPAQAGNSSYAFAAQVSITIPGTVHQFGTANLVVDCYDNSTPPQQVEPDKIQISPTTYNVTINFSTAQTGYCVVNGAGTASVGGGGGAVNSVYGRSGAVTAQTGDYSFGQISGAVGSSQLPGAGGDLGGTLGAAIVTGIQSRAVSNTAPA